MHVTANVTHRAQDNAGLGNLPKEDQVPDRRVCLLSLWPDGRFRFEPGEVEPGDDVELDLELDRLLLEGLIQADLTQGGA